jgi:WD40 repeat protein
LDSANIGGLEDISMLGTRFGLAALGIVVLAAVGAGAPPKAGDKAPDAAPALKDLTGIQRLAYSPDGKLLLIAYNVPPNFTGAAHAGVWDAATGKFVVAMDKAPDHCNQIAFSPDGVKAAGISAGDKQLRVWDAASGKVTQDVALPEWKQFMPNAPFLAFSPDGANLSSLYKQQILRAKLGGDVKLAPGDLPNWAVEWIGFAPATETLVQAVNPPPGKKGGNKLLVYDLSKPGDPQTVPVNGWIRSIGVAPDGKTAVVAYERELKKTTWIPGKVEIWDMQTWKVRSTLPADGRKDFGAYQRLFVSPDGNTIAGVPNFDGKLPNAVELVDKDGKLLREIVSPPELADLAFSPDGKTAAIAQGNNPILFVDTATGKDKEP